MVMLFRRLLSNTLSNGYTICTIVLPKSNLFHYKGKLYRVRIANYFVIYIMNRMF